jgi:hypothetical protein
LLSLCFIFPKIDAIQIVDPLHVNPGHFAGVPGMAISAKMPVDH